MEAEQIISKAITRAIQTMAEAWVERMHNASGPKIGSPTMTRIHKISIVS